MITQDSNPEFSKLFFQNITDFKNLSQQGLCAHVRMLIWEDQFKEKVYLE